MRFCCQGPSLAVHTPAKLNLYLEVLGRRPDGYHELETVMVSVGLYDSLLFTEEDSDQTRLECRHAAPRLANTPVISTGSDNLVVRAADLLREYTGCGRGVKIVLWKRIPMQAGLGGGSSDAAAALVGLNRLWQLSLSAIELHMLAAQLGSDVNFFLDSPLAAVCTGRGEHITPVAVSQRLHFVVACPTTGLSTSDVFRQFQAKSNSVRDVSTVAESLTSRRRGSLAAGMHNALEAPARDLNSDVSRTLDALSRSGATTVLMSGSGTACFGLCRSARHARVIAGRLRLKHRGTVYAMDTRA